jgi:hypothetical protein
MIIVRGNGSTGRKPVPVSLCPPQILHDLTWAQSRWLTTWAVVPPAWSYTFAPLFINMTWSLITRWNSYTHLAFRLHNTNHASKQFYNLIEMLHNSVWFIIEPVTGTSHYSSRQEASQNAVAYAPCLFWQVQLNTPKSKEFPLNSNVWISTCSRLQEISCALYGEKLQLLYRHFTAFRESSPEWGCDRKK